MTTKERKALGRGFNALLQSVDDYNRPVNSADVQQISIENICLNPKQPRQTFNEEKLNELAQSIRIKGVLQPILVRRTDSAPKEFELIAGERRLRASKLAGFDKVPALIKQIRDEDLLEVALIENIQRDNLNPMEESIAYRNLIDEHGYTQEDLAKRVGKNRSTVANMLRLLQLPEEIKTEIAAENLSVGHARTILSLDNKEDQIRLKDQVIEDNISVRDTERIVKDNKSGKKGNIVKQTIESSPDSIQTNMNQDRLREYLSTKVTIKHRGKKGKIELEYYDDEDFNRIFDLILKGSN